MQISGHELDVIANFVDIYESVCKNNDDYIAAEIAYDRTAKLYVGGVGCMSSARFKKVLLYLLKRFNPNAYTVVKLTLFTSG